MAEITWSEHAEADLKMIFEYISNDSRVYAEKVIDKIYNRTSILETHIRMGRVVPEFENPMIRELIEGNYRIIYEMINENAIAIFAHFS